MTIKDFRSETLIGFAEDPFKSEKVREAAKKELQSRALDELTKLSEELGLYGEEE